MNQQRQKKRISAWAITVIAALLLLMLLVVLLHSASTTLTAQDNLRPVPSDVPSQATKVAAQPANPVAQVPTPPGTATIASGGAAPATVNPGGASTRLFTIPSGVKGIIVWANEGDLYGIARSPDGITWVGNWTKGESPEGGMLLRYAPDGTRLPVLVAPGGEASGWDGGFVADLEGYGSTLFGLIQNELYKLDWNGQVLAHHDLYGLLTPRGPDDPEAALLIGGNGEALLSQTQAGILSQIIIGPDDKATLQQLDGYPAKSADGVAHAYYKTTIRNGKGIIELAGKPVAEIQGNDPLIGLYIFHIGYDGGFYAMAEAVGGNPPAPFQTVLRYNSKGELIDQALLPIPGSFMHVIRRTTVDSHGDVYALVGDQWRGFAVERLNFYPPSTIPPTIVVPTYTPTPVIPTATPTPHLLNDMAQQADKIAQVEVTASYSGSKVLKVARYFKIDEWSNGKADGGIYNTPYIRVVGPDADLNLLTPGKSYIVFLIKETHSWCDSQGPQNGPYKVLSGAPGVYEIKDGQISNYDATDNNDMPLDNFINQLQTLVGNAHPTLTPIVDTGFDDLARLAHSADVIAKVTRDSIEGGAGRIFETFTVTKWLKRSPSFADNSIYFSFSKCETMPSYSDAGRFILFVHKEIIQHPMDGPMEWTYLTGGYDGIFAISYDGIVVDAGLGRYMGWTLDALEAEIQRALSTPVTPTPTISPSP